MVLLQGMLSAIQEAIKTGMAQTKNMIKTAANWGKNFMRKLAVLGVLVGALSTWGVFVLTVLLTDMTHIELGTAVAMAVADTIVVVIMFIIDAIPVVGAIISAIIYLIDGMVSALCAAAGWDSEEAGDTDPYNDAGDWLCGGIEGLVSALLSWVFYAGTIMVDLQNRELKEGETFRLQFGELDANDLVYPEKGMAVGNQIKVSLQLTNTIDLVDLPENVGKAYWYQYDEENLRSSTFVYALQDSEEALHEGISRNAMSDDWQGYGPVSESWQVGPVNFPLEEAGINRAMPVILSEGYAIPMQECALGVCYIRTQSNTNHFPLSASLKFDVFPATLDEFYHLESFADGYALSWGQYGDDETVSVPSFPRLKDADGDTLPFGVDSNDLLWDSDADGLSDSFEASNGSNPDSRDSDGDGLGDYQEVQIGTHPMRKDTDGDGLWDGQEALHQDQFDQDQDGDAAEWLGGWKFIYAVLPNGTNLFTWVTSDPLEIDGDGDQLTDADELRYGFNPNVPSVANVLSMAASVNEQDAGGRYVPGDGYVSPSDTLQYQAELTNQLDNRYAQGLHSAEFPAGMNSDVLPEAFILQPQETDIITGEVTVSADASGVYSLTQSVGASIVDWTALARNALLWLPFEDPITSDRSGHTYDGVCYGVCASASGRFGNAVSLDGSSSISSPADPPETGYAVSLWFNTAQANGTMFSAADTAPGTQVYLQNGRVCADVYYESGAPETKCSTAMYNDSQWHHLVHTFGPTARSGSAGQALYVDGLATASGSDSRAVLPRSAGVMIGRSAIPGRANFTGLLDDVRVFDESLSVSQARNLFNQPVFAMSFNDASAWPDSSAFDNDAACQSPYCPQHSPAGVIGSAVAFAGQNQFVSVPQDASLDLSAGTFTIASWVNPNPASALASENCILWRDVEGGTLCDQFLPEGILGWNSGSAAAYPSLQRQLVFDPVGRNYVNRLRFGFATSSGWAGYYDSRPGILPDNQWSFVALTFANGMLKLYVNGELVDQDSGIFAGKTPAATASFEIGRSSHTGQIEFGEVYINHAGYDQGGGDNEFCMALRTSPLERSSIFGQQIKEDKQYTIGAIRSFENVGTLTIWEDDEGTTCGTAADGGDQAIASWTIDITDPNTGRIPLESCILGPEWGDFTACHTFTGEVGGYFSYKYQHDSSPFNGKVDEVQIFRSALDAETVKNMYWGMSTALRLELDEAPGETVFDDSSPAGRDAACTGSGCPTTGLSGRINRAAGFEAAESDRIELADFGDFGQTTVSAWVYRRGANDAAAKQAIVSYKESDGCGFQLSLVKNGTQYNPQFTVNVLNGGSSSWQSVQGSAALPLSEWAHLAGVYDGLQLRLYQNGVLLNSTAAIGAMKQCSGKTAIGSSSSFARDYFDGQIDDVFIFSQALSAGEIESLYQNAPVFQMKFDDVQQASSPDALQFMDSANGGNHGVCTAQACPATGEAISGQIDFAAQFDSRNDVVVVENDAALRQEHFSMAAWVYPTAIRDNDQEIMVKGLWDPATSARPLFTNYRLFIEAGSLTPSVEFDQFCSGQFAKATSAVGLIKDHWNHLAATFDGKFLRLYLNGSEQAFWESTAFDTVSPCQVDEAAYPLQIGGLTEYDAVWGHGFAGKLDEVTLYAQPLSDAEIYAIYQYQAGWVQQRQRTNIVVDNDVPSVSLYTPGTYLPQAGIRLLAVAADDTSGVAQVNFGSCQSPGACTPAITSPADSCQDSGDGAWCPLFDPPAEGRYLLGAIAVDQVSNSSPASTPLTVYVDDQAPALTFDMADGALLSAFPHPNQANTWAVRLSGTVSDPPLADSSAGSGVQPQSVVVTLLTAQGGSVGAGRQIARVSGSQWSLDYALTNNQSSGAYTVQVEAADNVTLLAGLSSDQIERHTAAQETHIFVDTTAPLVVLDESLPLTATLNLSSTLSGGISEQPVPLNITWDTPATGGEQAALNVRCGSGGTDFLTLADFPAGAFAAEGKTYSWNKYAPRGAACLLDIQGSGVSGQISVCGEQLQTWAADYGSSISIPFTVESPACGDLLAVSGGRLS